jgi:hypothetical protein
MNANQHTHGVTGPGHSHTILGTHADEVINDEIHDDKAYMGAHLHENCRCSITAIAPEVLDRAARAEGEYQLTVKLDPAAVDALMDEMRKTIAAALGLRPEMLFGGEAAPAVSQEYRALMTVAKFPNTPE